MPIRIVIVDDEPLARRGVLARLKGLADIEVVGEAADGLAAVNAIKTLRPDLVFLDIQLPGVDGLEVLRRVSPEHLPSVIFVTAYDRYAVEAFEANAIDYLLKPYSRQRFERALDRARIELAKDAVVAETHVKLLRLLHTQREAPGVDTGRAVKAEEAYVDRVAVKDRDRYVILKTDAIEWIDSAANYVQLHAGGRTFLLRTTMNELEGRLNPKFFIRIHRAAIVNVESVSQILPSEHGDVAVVMRDGTNLRLSRTYRDRLLSRIYPYQRDDSSSDVSA